MRYLVLLLSLLTPLTATAARSRAVRHPSAPPSGPTFSKEVVRIFQAHCQTCHHPGDIAPFSLTSYAEARPWAAMIKIMTSSRRMPPWKPVDGCGDFHDARKLTQEQIDTIAEWVSNGAPEGNPADLPTPIDFGSGWELGQPDMILKNAEAFTPPAGTDTYRCFTIPTYLTSRGSVAAVDVHPGDRQTVHHLISFIDTTGVSQTLDEQDPGPGYTCFGDPGFSVTGTLGGWAPGARALQMPENIAFELPAASRVVLQVHYHPHHGLQPGPDQTELGIYFAKQPPEKYMQIIPIINTTFTIPPHDGAYQVKAEFPLLTPFPTKIWVIAPHMHLLGRKMQVEMTHVPTNKTTCLINIEDWDFNWQGTYRFKEPISVPAGTRLSLKAIYDNSSNNPKNPNSPPRPVSWGEQTTDEMCIAFIGVTTD
jgi:hypothetical protein